MRSSGHHRPKKWQRWSLGPRFWLGARTPVIMEVGEGEDSYRFVCDNMLLVRRATSLFVKEEGTVAWLKQSLGPGKIFLDIGANIGVYTLMAARLVGDKGHVYAVEPHIPNAQRLFENIAANGFQRRVSVITAAMAEAQSYGDFLYNEWSAGSSLSQFERAHNGSEAPKSIGTREVKLGVSVDSLVEAEVISPPDAIKIDIDGLEPEVLAGMKRLLLSEEGPTTIQVEVQPDTMERVEDFFEKLDYYFDHRHFTQSGKKYLARGVPEAKIAHNMVYRKKGA